MSKSPAPPLRIGVVCFSTFGGSGVVAAEVATSLARRGHALHVFSDDVPGRLDPTQPNIAFHRVAPPAYPQLKHSQYTLALTSKIVEVSRRERLDVIHAHYALPHAVSAHLAREVLASDAGGPAAAPRLVTTLHGTDITLVGSDPSFLPLTRFSIAASDAVTTPSAWLARATHETLGVPDTVDIEIVPNFVDADRFRPVPGERPLPDSPVVVHVSNFRPVKRVADVVEVFARLRATRPARLRLIGDGPDRAAVEVRAAALGLAADVEFLGERVDLPAVLQEADLFSSPARPRASAWPRWRRWPAACRWSPPPSAGSPRSSPTARSARSARSATSRPWPPPPGASSATPSSTAASRARRAGSPRAATGSSRRSIATSRSTAASSPRPALQRR